MIRLASDSRALPLVDALPLAHVLAADVARNAGVHALIIKGPSAAFHGVRLDRVSADVDILVAPSGLEDYVESLRRVGWVERRIGDPDGVTDDHSRTFFHSNWPCDIDVHAFFPGFLGSPARVFEVLWGQHRSMAHAGFDLPIVDRSGAMLIGALHALRLPEFTPRHQEEIAYLIGEVFPALTAVERLDIVTLAVETGAIDTARPVIVQLGVELPPPTGHGVDRNLDNWRIQVGGRGAILAHWLPVLARTRWSDLPSLLIRMVWPSDAVFRSLHPQTPTGIGHSIIGRLARVARGLASLPDAARGLILSQRGITDGSLYRVGPVTVRRFGTRLDGCLVRGARRDPQP